MRRVKEGEQLESYGKVFGDFKILKIFSYDKILVEFVDTGFQAISHWRQVESGTIRDGFVPTVRDIGFLGQGEYDKHNSENAYYIWVHMLRRAYDKKYHERQPTYKNVTVCKEWLNFQNFAEWFDDQDFEKGWELDKDLVKPGNKIYCKEYCNMIPKWLNRLFPNPSKRKDKKIPQSVEKVYKKGKIFYRGYGHFNGIGRVRGEIRKTINEAEIDALCFKRDSVNDELYCYNISDNLIDFIIDRIKIIEERISFLESINEKK